MLATSGEQSTWSGMTYVASIVDNDIVAVIRTCASWPTMGTAVSWSTSSSSILGFGGVASLLPNQVNVFVVMLFRHAIIVQNRRVGINSAGIASILEHIVRVGRHRKAFLGTATSSTAAGMDFDLHRQRIRMRTIRSVLVAAAVRIEQIFHAIVNHFLGIMQVEWLPGHAATGTGRRQQSITHWINVEPVIRNHAAVKFGWSARLIVSALLTRPKTRRMQIEGFCIRTARRWFRQECVVRWRRHLLVIRTLGFCGLCSDTAIDVIAWCSVLHQRIQALWKKTACYWSTLELTRAKRTSTCWFSAASLIGLFPYLSKDNLAPWLSNHRTAVRWPLEAAKCRGVAPSPSLKFGSTPWSSTWRTTQIEILLCKSTLSTLMTLQRQQHASRTKAVNNRCWHNGNSFNRPNNFPAYQTPLRPFRNKTPSNRVCTK